MNEQVESLRQRIKIHEVIGHDTPLTERLPKSWKGACPGCRKNQFYCNEGKGIYKCFDCGVGGDIFSYVMHFKKLSFESACKYISDLADELEIKQSFQAVEHHHQP